MDLRAKIKGAGEKLKASKKRIMLFVFGGLGLAVAFILGPKIWHHVHHQLIEGSVIGHTAHAVHEVVRKTKELAYADKENRRLNYENANLKLEWERLKYSCKSEDAAAATQRIGLNLDQETQSRVGRTLASIDYRLPHNQTPKELFTTAVAFLKAKEFERAAVIFTYLTGLERIDEFKTPQNFLSAAVAWYELEHYKLSLDYLNRILDRPDREENLHLKAQARLWKAIVAMRLKHHDESQERLLELVNHHPKSREAGWINPAGIGGKRVPASH